MVYGTIEFDKEAKKNVLGFDKGQLNKFGVGKKTEVYISTETDLGGLIKCGEFNLKCNLVDATTGLILSVLNTILILTGSYFIFSSI